MANILANYHNRVLEEIDKMPVEYLPALLQVIHIFRESISRKSADESFQQGWKEILRGETSPISKLWDNIDAE
jgi:hypothetical protein